MSMRVRKVCLIIFGLIPSDQFKHILNYIRIQIVIKLAVVHQENGNGSRFFVVVKLNVSGSILLIKQQKKYNSVFDKPSIFRQTKTETPGLA